MSPRKGGSKGNLPRGVKGRVPNKDMSTKGSGVKGKIPDKGMPAKAPRRKQSR